MEEILNLVGHTPLVILQREPARIAAKLEWCSVGGSVKDRAAAYMLWDALHRGLLRPGDRVVEATSGNTGIGLAWVGKYLGLRVTLVMPADTPLKKQQLPQLFGAQVELTPPQLGMAGANARAEELPGFHPRQFENPANVQAHLETTGPEILTQAGKVDVFVSGIGSGGTLTGVGRFLKRNCPGVHIAAVEPLGNISGIGPNFRPPILDERVIDETIPITLQQAQQAAARAAEHWGIGPGPSGGANLAAALSLGQRPEFYGKTIATILPDHMERYL
jgi:cysteine synthase A